MKRIMTSLQSYLVVTKHEATVLLWLSCLMVVGTVGSTFWPAYSSHAHVPTRQIIDMLDSLQHSAVHVTADSTDRETHIPTKPSVPTSRLDLNRATPAQLESIPGIGPAIAKRIIESRAKRSFTSVEDLLDVKGIGKKKLERMRPYIFAP